MTDTTPRFSPATEIAIKALQAAEKGPAWKRAGAFVVIPPRSTVAEFNDPGHKLTLKSFGKIKVAYPADGAGRLRVWVWDCIGSDVQYGTASGGGYDKLSAALSGLTFDGLTLTDHPQNWESQLREAGYTIISAI
jgi:hypothetical protein